MNCSRCKSALPADASFCAHCGLSTAGINAETLRDDPQITSELRDPLLGKVLDSKYEILERLGEGGMGAVYRARRLHIGDEVAVKVLSKKLILNNEVVERFRREARSAAMIRHANVVTIHDFGEARSGGAPAYIVMELVKGMSLRKILIEEGRLPIERAAWLLRDVCAGVGLAHRQGVIHRDLKPDNVIIVPATIDGERETAKVVDFGLARLQETHSDLVLTRSGAMIGSPLYMSPEQCRGDTLDERADVYSLGAMLYEMLVGQPPFPATNVAELMSQHLTARPPKLPESLGTSPALNELYLRALSKKPEDRPRDAIEFNRQLQSAINGPLPTKTSDVVAAHATTPTKRPGNIERKTNRKTLVIGLAAILLVGAVVGVLGIALFANNFMNRGRLPGLLNQSPVPAIKPNTQEPPVSNSNKSSVVVAHNPDQTGSPVPETNLVGEWQGTYGPIQTPATLVIKVAANGKLTGILTQGSVQVAFDGTYEMESRRITMKETRVLAGNGWSLGENSGLLSLDGRSMSGTGRDATGARYGISYDWSFEKL